MDDIKLAMLGNKEAAQRLTDAGVLLACPCCGGKPRCFGSTSIAYVRCNGCGLEICRMDADGEDIISRICSVWPKYDARLAWNTRAPVLSAEGMELLEGME